MNEIQTYNGIFGAVRVIMQGGEPWFVAKDIADALGYSNARDAISKHVDDEDRNTVAIRDGIGNPNTTIINESGLYSLIFASKLDSAKKFKRWVTSDVLPSIRKTGTYTMSVEERVEASHKEKARIIRNIELVRAVMLKEGLSAETIGDMMYQLCDQHDLILPNFFIHMDKITRNDIIDIIKFVQDGKYKNYDCEFIYIDYLIANTECRRRKCPKLVQHAKF